MFAGNFAPAGWMFCAGQKLPISENETLFQLIGTTFGGDGQETFNLPDLQGRVPVHQGTGPTGQTYQLGEVFGVESVTLTTQQMPLHNHAFLASTSAGTTANASGNVTAASPSVQLYTQDVASQQFAQTMLTPSGGSQPHDNLMPYISIYYIISLFGIFPSPT